MNLTTISISPDEAESQLAEYTSVPYEQRSIEDDSIAMALRAAKRGNPIIVMSEVIRAGGFFETTHQPRLALARADAHRVRVFQSGEDIIYDTSDTRWGTVNRGALVGEESAKVRDVMPRDENGQRLFMRAGQTVVPLIPPRHRPKGRRLGLFHVLWEVEKWDPTPPVDPALVRHIRGDLWAVISMWDLTDLERAVLAARA